MQLIFETDAKTCITENMALIEKDSVNEKFTDKIIDDLSNSISNGNKENIEKRDNFETDTGTLPTVDIAKNKEHNGEENSCELVIDISDKPQESSHNLKNNIEQNVDISKPTDQAETNLNASKDLVDPDKIHVENGANKLLDNEENINTENDPKEIEPPCNNSTENNAETGLEEIDQPAIETNICKNVLTELNSGNGSEKCNIDEDGNKTPDNITSNDMDVDEIAERTEDTGNKAQDATADVQDLDKEKGESNDCQVINSLPDKIIETRHKEDSAESAEEKNILDKNDSSNDEISKAQELRYSTETLNEDKNEEATELNLSESDKDVREIGLKNKSTLDESKTETVVTFTIDEDKSKEKFNSTMEDKTSKKPPRAKITLDILSDDEESTLEDKNGADVANETKQCINIEDDDDDIMLIDDTSTKDKDTVETTVVEKKPVEDAVTQEKEASVLDNKLNEKVDIITTVNKDSANDEKTKADVKKVDEDIKEEKENTKALSPKPLLPKNFVSSCKKNLAEMTRNDLEELCILKIVESVVDRGNLGEIKNQLKKMTQNIEEYQNKTKSLMKQNHALQVVLKSVQEELKKNTNGPITPLKISRSVGIQVLMPDKIKRKSTNPNTSPASNVINASPIKTMWGPPPLVARSAKAETVSQQIPVPRLVPAGTGVKPTASSPSPTLNKSVTAAPPTNKTPSTKKPVKRPSVAKVANSDTVDLTDDEPPLKVTVRAGNNQVRVVPSHNLMAPQRAPIGTVMNHPRQVYIPISGGQAQNVRPGQTFMLKTINAQNVRPRMNKEPYRRASIGTHPAPLPEIAKQCQPPNCKLIPPAPEIKLSKVENGIVISWKLDNFHEENHESIANYQIYAYQETSSPPNTNLWKKIGDVKALPLPMACTLTQFMAGYKYYFAVRAVDNRSRIGPFSSPGNIMLK